MRGGAGAASLLSCERSPALQPRRRLRVAQAVADGGVLQAQVWPRPLQVPKGFSSMLESVKDK